MKISSSVRGRISKKTISIFSKKESTSSREARTVSVCRRPRFSCRRTASPAEVKTPAVFPGPVRKHALDLLQSFLQAGQIFRQEQAPAVQKPDVVTDVLQLPQVVG